MSRSGLRNHTFYTERINVSGVVGKLEIADLMDRAGSFGNCDSTLGQ
jgi:hypothetical protein